MSPTQAKAIVLRAYALGENDKIVCLFTREAGFLRVAAKGARKPGNRWSGHLEPLSRTWVQIARGRGSLRSLQSAVSRESSSRLFGNLDRLLGAIRMAESTIALVPEELPHEDVFDALDYALDGLCQGLTPTVVTIWYELALLDAAGYRPELAQCVSCLSSLDQRSGIFCVELCGIRCEPCCQSSTQGDSRKSGSSERPLSVAEIHSLQGLQAVPLQRLSGFECGSASLAYASNVVTAAIRYHSQRPLPSAELWRRLGHAQ